MRKLAIIMCLFLALRAEAQTDRYFVFFRDKSNSPYSISNPSAFLSPKSLARRAKQGVAVVEEDLPVNTNYIQQVKSTGAKTYFTSKWWNGVLVQTDAATISAINALPFVTKTELVAPGLRLMGGRIAKKDNDASTSSTGSTNATEFQLSQIALDKMQDQGYKGDGIDVAQFDSGWIGVNTASPFQVLLSEGRIKSTYNFVTNTSTVYTADDHGTQVLSVMAALVPSSFTGGAYKANFFLYLTEDVASEYRIEEYNWTFAAEKADSAGVDVINSSLGYNTFDLASMNYSYTDMNGSGTVISVSAKKAVEKGIVVVCSAGNEGARSWKYVTAPADVNGVIAVGSVTSSGSKSTSSSFGPTADGRIKPDVVALGSGTAVITSSGSLGTASGTSLASPLIACLAAGLLQANPTLKPTKIVEAIVKSGSQYNNPDNLKGYGVPSFVTADQILKTPDQTSLIDVYPTLIDSSTDQGVIVSFKEPVENVSIEMFDMVGRSFGVVNGQITVQHLQININTGALGPGMYVVRIESPKGSYTTRVFKMK